MTPILEICCADAHSVMDARQGGADRIELCCALSEGGLTPSDALIQYACDVMHNSVHVLIRPRGCDFLYNADEISIMCRDIDRAVSLGASGIVVGALTPDGDVDTDACKEMLAAANGRNATFHRAFDLCRNPQQALETIIDLGFTHLLTSGLAATAVQGLEMLKKLHQQADGRIEIIAAGGINPENAAEICNAGISQLHASAKRRISSNMVFRRSDVNMGTPGSDEYSRMVTDADIVSRIKASLSSNK